MGYLGLECFSSYVGHSPIVFGPPTSGFQGCIFLSLTRAELHETSRNCWQGTGAGR